MDISSSRRALRCMFWSHCLLVFFSYCSFQEANRKHFKLQQDYCSGTLRESRAVHSDHQRGPMQGTAWQWTGSLWSTSDLGKSWVTSQRCFISSWVVRLSLKKHRGMENLMLTSAWAQCLQHAGVLAGLGSWVDNSYQLTSYRRTKTCVSKIPIKHLDPIGNAEDKWHIKYV